MVGPVAEDPQHREHEGLVIRDRHATAYYPDGRVVERLWGRFQLPQLSMRDAPGWATAAHASHTGRRRCCPSRTVPPPRRARRRRVSLVHLLRPVLESLREVGRVTRLRAVGPAQVEERVHPLPVRRERDLHDVTVAQRDEPLGQICGNL